MPVATVLQDLRQSSSDPHWQAVVKYLTDNWDWFFTADGKAYKPDFALPHWDTLNGIAASLAAKRGLMKLGWANAESIATVKDFDEAANSAAQQAAAKAAAQKMTAQQKAAAAKGQQTAPQRTAFSWLLPLGLLGYGLYMFGGRRR